MSDWQPIETAPKNGTFVLIYRAHRITASYWDNDEYAKNPKPHWSDYVMGKAWARSNHPTHWMPLPEPPKGK